MPQLYGARKFFALFTLALGGFGIGVTEFASMGLLPQIAQDLLPGFDTAPEQTIATAGIMVSAYALGVVVGAPTIAILAARVSQTSLTLWLLIAFAVANLGSGLMPGFHSTVALRFLSGIPHGAYFGVASLLAARIMGPGKQGKGVALALSGLTIANVIGVPLVTWLGQATHWRWAYVAVAIIFGLTLALALVTLPRIPGDPTRDARKDLQAFRRPQLWLVMGVGAIGFAGFFAVYSYLAEVVVRVTGYQESMVPWILATLGVGMTIGNVVGGWASDRYQRGTGIVGFVGLISATVLYTVTATHQVMIFVSLFLIGFMSSMLLPAVQARLIIVAGKAELLGAALNHAAFNVANSLGAWIGGLVIASGFGYVAPGWASAALGVGGLVLILISFGLERFPRFRADGGDGPCAASPSANSDNGKRSATEPAPAPTLQTTHPC